MSANPTTVDLNGNTLARGYFSGIGQDLTSLDAGNIASGTLDDARLSTDVPLKGAENAWSANNQFYPTAFQGIATGPGWYRISANLSPNRITQPTMLFISVEDNIAPRQAFSVAVTNNLYGATQVLTLLGAETIVSPLITQVRAGGDGSHNFLDLNISGLAPGRTMNLFVQQTGSAALALAFNPTTTPSSVTLDVPIEGTAVSGDLTVSGGLRGGIRMTANTSGTIAFNGNGEWETIYNTSASTIPSATISLPSASTQGQVLRYVTAGALSSVTVGGTVDIGAALTSLPANGSVEWQAEAFSAGSARWIRTR